MRLRVGDRFLHPLRSRGVDEVCRADDVVAVTTAVRSRDLRRSDRVVRRAARSIARDVTVHGRAGDGLRELEVAECDLVDRVHVTGTRPGRAPRRVVVRGPAGRPVTVEEAWTECERLGRALEAAPTLDHHRAVGPLARLLGTLLLGVDVAALFLVFARVLNLDWSAPAPVPLVGTAVFSVIGAATLTRLATLLGEHLWVWRRQGPLGEPTARAGVAAALGGALGVLSLATGTGILLRILGDATELGLGALGTVLGLLVGAAAATGPWLLVHAGAHDGTELTRALGHVAGVVAWTDRRHRRLGTASDRLRARRRRARERAELRLRRAELAVVRCHRRRDEVLLLAAVHRGERVTTPAEGPRLVPGPHDELAPLRAMVELMQRGL